MKESGPYYPLTAAQNILFYNQKFTLHKQVNNIFTLTLLEKELDFTTLAEAVRLAYEHNDALRIRLKKVNGTVRQYFTPSETPKIRLLDFSGKKQEAMDRKLYRLAAKPFYLFNRPMSRVFLVRSTDGMTGVYFGVSHVVLDSWGICVLIKYIVDIYEAMKGSAPMPKRLSPHEPLLAQDAQYRETPQYGKDLEFWQQECTREQPWYTHVNGPGVLEAYRRQKRNGALQGSSGFTLRTKALHETIVIPADKVETMEAYCAARGLPMQTLFMLAVRTCLSARNGRQKDVSFYATVARRGTLQEKQSGGTRVHPFIFRTVIGEDSTFLSALEQIRSRQSLLYRHAEMDMLEVLKLMEEAYYKGDLMATHQSVCLTFQPVRLTLPGGAPCHTKWYCNGASSQPFYLTVMDDDGSGGLRCYYEYQKSIVERNTVITFHEDMVKAILTGIGNETVTIGELLDLLRPRADEQAR